MTQNNNQDNIQQKFEENGWIISPHDMTQLDGVVTYVYLFDYETKWTWMVALSSDEFVRVSNKQVMKSKSKRMKVIDSLLTFMLALSKNKIPLEACESRLADLACKYAAETITWSVMNKFQDGGHFVVIRYPGISEKYACLRPVAASANVKAGALSMGEFESLINNAIFVDKTLHPEYFRNVDSYS